MGGGMKLSSHARAALMNRLANSAGLQSGNPFNIPGTAASTAQTGAAKPAPSPLSYDQGVLGPASPRPTPCLLIKNMFDASECALLSPLRQHPFTVFRESDPNWAHDIEQDVADECAKYGTISHIHADPQSKVSHTTML